tara:strand:- start:252 stop:368 length:117 start_codon:yes stop_codon:yes gene_type:complete
VVLEAVLQAAAVADTMVVVLVAHKLEMVLKQVVVDLVT